MATHVTDEKKAEIRNTADIAEVVAERVALKKAGKDFTGLCPFHSEKTPSFTVSQTKQIFHCFGCGAGGDVFDFLMKSEGITFPEAVESLARRYGIRLPSRSMSRKEKQAVSEREQLFQINRRALAYFREQLLGRSTGEAARRYLKERGFSDRVIKSFGLGYAPEGWDNLIRLFRKERIPLPMAEKAGLVIARSSKSGYYDRFRSRIIFPIVDVTRQVVGFGGRVLDEGTPKYLNSPETPLYNKSRTLYGLHAAKDKCRETGVVYIVEGYFDLLAMHQHGFANSVATLGTSLTRAHVRMLRRGYATKARLVFDSDAAGVKAALRSISLFMEEGVEAEIIVLPQGEDPDSFLFAKGAEAFLEQAYAARGAFEFLIEQSVQAHGLSMHGRIRIIDELKEPLSEIPDQVARSLYIRYLSERVGVEEDALLQRVKAVRSERGRRLKSRGKAEEPDAACKDGLAEFADNRIERRIIAMMLQFPEIVPDLENRGIIDYFESERLRELAALILSHPPPSTADTSGLLNRIEDGEKRQLLASLAIGEECWDRASCEKLVMQFLSARKRRQNGLLDQIKAAEAENDQERLFALLKEKQKQMAKSG